MVTPGDTPSRPGRGLPAEGDRLGPSLWQSPFAPCTPRFSNASESHALCMCARWGKRSVTTESVGQGSANPPRPRRYHAWSQLQALLSPRGGWKQPEHGRSQCPCLGVLSQESWGALGCSARPPHKARVRRQLHALQPELRFFCCCKNKVLRGTKKKTGTKKSSPCSPP